MNHNKQEIVSFIEIITKLLQPTVRLHTFITVLSEILKHSPPTTQEEIPIPIEEPTTQLPTPTQPIEELTTQPIEENPIEKLTQPIEELTPTQSIEENPIEESLSKESIKHTQPYITITTTVSEYDRDGNKIK